MQVYGIKSHLVYYKLVDEQHYVCNCLIKLHLKFEIFYVFR